MLQCVHDHTITCSNDELVVFFDKYDDRIVVVGKAIFVSRITNSIAKKVEELEAALDKANKRVTKKLRLIDDMVVRVGQFALADYIVADVNNGVAVTKNVTYVTFEVSTIIIIVGSACS